MGGILRYGMGPNVEHLFQLRYSGGACAAWCMTVGDPLTAYGPDSEWDKKKSLAESFSLSADQKTITFSLKPGIKFHDGTDYNAQASKVSLDFVLDKENAAVTRSAIQSIIKVEVIDELTLSVTTDEVFAPIITNLGMTAGMPFSPTAFASMGIDGFETSGNPSTGPFKIGEWVSGSHITFEKFADYHQEGKPYLDGWRWVEIPEDVVRAAAMQAGELDVMAIGAGSRDGITSLRKISGIQEFKSLAGPRMDHFNAARAPFDDIRVRQAAQMAMDRVGWNEAINGGEGHVYMGSLVPPTHAASFEVKEYPYEYDPERARELLEEYAADKGISLPLDTLSAFTCSAQQKEDGCIDIPERPITITTTASSANVARAELSKAYYEAVGFKVEMDLGAGDEAKRTFVTKEASFSLRGFGLRPHPSGTFNSYLGMGGYWNNGGWGTSPEQIEIDRLVNAAAATFDIDEQNELYKQAQELYMTAALGGVRMAHSPGYHFAISTVNWDGGPDTKWIKFPSDASLHIHDVWLER
jgi:ABC-type transport system substrate-binding protein